MTEFIYICIIAVLAIYSIFLTIAYLNVRSFKDMYLDKLIEEDQIKDAARIREDANIMFVKREKEGYYELLPKDENFGKLKLVQPELKKESPILEPDGVHWHEDRPGINPQTFEVKTSNLKPSEVVERFEKTVENVLPGNSNPQATILGSDWDIDKIKEAANDYIDPNTLDSRPRVNSEVMSGVLNILGSIKEHKSIKRKLDKDELDFFSGLTMKDGKIVKKTSN